MAFPRLLMEGSRGGTMFARNFSDGVWMGEKYEGDVVGRVI